MSVLRKITVLHGSTKVAAALRFGFEREGGGVTQASDAKGLRAAIADGCQLVVTGGRTKEDAKQKLSIIRGVLQGGAGRVRVLYFGNSVSRAEALAGGADEFLTPPAFIRDVVTLGKLMATPMERRTQSISGELSDHFGLFYLVRALAVARYSGVLTLLRGLRRGELRLYQGEVISGKMGGREGVLALHHSLLWSHARFDLREERIPTSRQISLTRSEMLRGCEEFLRGVRIAGGGMSLSATLEPVAARDLSLVPTQVGVVLEMFDGVCSVSDAIEDSPYQIVETLRIVVRLVDKGFLRRTSREASEQLSETALAIDEWLVGSASSCDSVGGPPLRSEAESQLGPATGQPASPPGFSSVARKNASKSKDLKSRRRKAENNTSPRREQSWSDVLPGPNSVANYGGGVPARVSSASGVPGSAGLGSAGLPMDMPSAGVSRSSSSRPSSRASRSGGTELPSIPARERLEEKDGVNSLATIFVDASLGAKDLERPLLRTQPKISTLDKIHRDAWDEEGDSSVSADSVLEESPATADSEDKAEDEAAQVVASSARLAEAAGAEVSHFSEEEEAFFDQGIEEPKPEPMHSDSFEDLDEHYEIPKSFWKRLLANPDMKQRKKKKD